MGRRREEEGSVLKSEYMSRMLAIVGVEKLGNIMTA